LWVGGPVGGGVRQDVSERIVVIHNPQPWRHAHEAALVSILLSPSYTRRGLATVDSYRNPGRRRALDASPGR